jgi:hypothetical protein
MRPSSANPTVSCHGLGHVGQSFDFIIQFCVLKTISVGSAAATRECNHAAALPEEPPSKASDQRRANVVSRNCFAGLPHWRPGRTSRGMPAATPPIDVYNNL